MMVFVIALFLVSSVFAAGACIPCEELANVPQARLNTIVDETNYRLEINAYYEDLSAAPTRQPINNSVLLIQLTNSTGLNELYKTYTDSQGKATFDFVAWKNGCINFKVLYCPFCNPESPQCGFQECLNFSRIETIYTNVTDIPEGPGGKEAPETLNPNLYLPTVDQKQYCPPPPPMAQTPALCLPLLIIFSLLGGALYLTGRNPFAGFNIGGARVGRHIRYQARGRGISFDLKAIAMSIRSAAGEMEIDGETGKRKGEQAQPRWFLYSSLKDLKDVAVGTAGKGGEGGRQISTQVTLAGGARGRPGIAAAFAQTARDARAGWVRTFGAETRDRSGKVTGREYGFAGVLKGWGTEFGLGLARVAAAAWDNTWISYITNLSARTALEGAIQSSQRHTRAAFLADLERMTDEFGRDIRDYGMRFKQGTTSVDTDGSITGRVGRRYISLGEVTAEDGTRARAVIIEPPQVGEGGQWSATVSLVSGSGATRRVTNYTFTNGTVTSVEQVLGAGTSQQIGASFRIGEGGTVVAQGVVIYGPGGSAPRLEEVRRDERGRVAGIGENIVIQYDQAGHAIVFDRSQPATQAGQPGRQIQNEPLNNAINMLLASDGRNMNTISGIIALNASNMQELMRNTMNTLNASCERTRQVYMEQFGLVRVTEGDLLGTMDEHGNVKRDASTYDASITIIDPSYSPSGERITRVGLESGSTITVVDGQYRSVTDAHGNAIPITTRVIDAERGIVETRIGANGPVLNTGSGENRDASSVRDHMQSLSQYATSVLESYSKYQAVLQAEAGRAFLDAHPEVRAGLDSVLQARSQVAEAFGESMRARGLSGDALDAAIALHRSIGFGGQELRLAGEIMLAAQEVRQAQNRALETGDRQFGPEDIEALSPRAQAYARLILSQRDPNSFEGQRTLLAQFDAISRQEYAAITAAASHDTPETRRALEELHLIPSGYTPARGETAADVAMANVLRHQEASTRLAVHDRVMDQVDDVMRARPNLIIPSSILGEPNEAPIAQRVATHMLGLGTQLVGMSDTDIRTRVGHAIMADPSISPENRALALEMVDSFIPAAREVARNYDTAARAMIDEVGSRPYRYAPHDADMGYAHMAGTLLAQRGSEESYAFMIEASRRLGSLPPDATPEQQNRVMGEFLADYYLRSNPPGTTTPANPLNLAEHQVMYILAAGGPNMRAIENIASSTPQNVSLSSEAPRPGSPEALNEYNPPAQGGRQYVGVDPSAVTGFVVGTTAALGAAMEFGYDMPRDVYEAAGRGMLAYNQGRFDAAQTEFTRSSVLASVLSDDHIRNEERYRETRRHAGEDIGPSPEFIQAYEAERRRASTATGIELGTFRREPHRPAEGTSEGGR